MVVAVSYCEYGISSEEVIGKVYANIVSDKCVSHGKHGSSEFC